MKSVAQIFRRGETTGEQSFRSSIITSLLAILLGIAISIFNLPYGLAVTIGLIIFTLIIILRWDALAVTLIIAVHVYVGYYLGIYLVAAIMPIALLLIFLVMESPRYPIVKPPALWIWILLLLLAIFPATQGITLTDGIKYYFNTFFLAFLMFWLGAIIAYDPTRIRQLLRLLSCVGTFVAFVSIIQYFTGTLLFSSPSHDLSVALTSDFAVLPNSNIHRVGAYFTYPNSNGAFIAMMLCIAAGLFVESSSWRGKFFYLIEICVLLPALLFTYSTESWIAMGAGIVCLLLLVGKNAYRIVIFFSILIGAIGLVVLFPAELGLLNHHTATANDLTLRLAGWETGIAVIYAFPLTGVGLGHYAYIQRANPYRVRAQHSPLYHPHNSFLELAAFGGLPMAIVFVCLFLVILWLAFRNWAAADVHTRTLIGTGIATAIALTSFSMSDTGWTLPPALAIGWLVLGAITSPFITKSLRDGIKEEKHA